VKFPLEEWRRGEIPTADKLNQPVNALNMIASQLGTEGSGLTSTQTPHGRILNLDLTRGVADVFFCSVVEEGPNGEPDSTFDELAGTYWVRRLALNGNATTLFGFGATTFLNEQPVTSTDPSGGTATYRTLIVPALNLAEQFAGEIGGLAVWPRRLKIGDAGGLCFGFYDNGGTKHYVFHSNLYDINEQEIGSSAADEGSEAADTEEWNINDDATGPCIWLTTRVLYDPGGAETLYGYKRQLKFDRGGRLYEVTGETRYTIDTPTDCPPPE
jgi:hypothetical protein